MLETLCRGIGHKIRDFNKIKQLSIKQLNMEDSLFGWVFIKQLDGNWAAAKREYYFELFNGDKGNVIRSKHIEDLESLIVKGEGDITKILKLVK